MRRRKGYTWALLFIIALLAFTGQVYSQASLAGENILDTIDIDGTLYTCVRDALNEDQWYYIPNSPRLVEHKVKGKMIPKFTLVRYQYKESGQFIEGGVLQFEINMALPPNVVGKIKDSIAKPLVAKRPEWFKPCSEPIVKNDKDGKAEIVEEVKETKKEETKKEEVKKK